MASSSAVPTDGLYEPLTPSYHPISDSDKGGYVLLTAVILIIVTGLTICVKLQITYSTFRKFRRDDLTLIAALIFAVAYTVAIGLSIQYGLGRAASESTGAQIRLLSQYYYAANILLYLSLAASKCSVTLLIIYIQPNRKIGAVLYALMGLVALWSIASVFVSALQCSPTRWVMGPTNSDTCIDQFAAQLGIKLADIATDVALAISPAFMMVKVQMSMDKRFVVGFMFALRLATPIFTALSIASLSDYYRHPTVERPLAATFPTIWTSFVVNTSLITACLPSIKRFLADWAAGVTAAPMLEAYELQNSSNNPNYGQHSGIRSFMRSQGRSKQGSKMDRSANMSHSGREREESAKVAQDSDSQRGLTDGIVQTTDYRVEYEEGRHQRFGSAGSGARM